MLWALLLWAVTAARAQGGEDASGAQPDPEVVQAAEATAGAEQADPPSRVVRLSLSQGAVSVEPGSVNEFTPAEVNQVLTSGDRVYTDPAAKAELESGQIAIRLSGGTDLTVTAMTDRVAQFGLADGAVHLRSLALEPGTVLELDTPEVALTVLEPGDVRVDEDPVAHLTTVTVLSGTVQMDGPQMSRQLMSGDRIRVGGESAETGEQASLEPLPSVPADGLDTFSDGRDQAFQNGILAGADLLNPDTTGSADLAGNGTWETDLEVGPVWFPVVAMGWRPYCYGHWRWVAPWGWTWVGAEPWAFAPFHYGRWVDVQGRWGWIPGTRALHPVYAPALVAFVGGKEFSASLGYLATPGVAAWFPLGPREPFTPLYHGSTGYVNRVNASNLFNTNVQEAKAIYHQRAVNVFAVEDGANRTYANRSSGTVAISQASFVGGQPVAKNLLHIPASTLAQAPVLVHLRVAPQLPTVVAGTPRATPPAGMATAPRTAGVEPSSLHRDQTAAGGGRRPEFFHTEAPPASRASFEAQRQGMPRFEPGRPAEAGRPETMHADHPSAAPAVREGGSRPTPAAPHEAEPSHPAPAAAASHK